MSLENRRLRELKVEGGRQLCWRMDPCSDLLRSFLLLPQERRGGPIPPSRKDLRPERQADGDDSRVGSVQPGTQALTCCAPLSPLHGHLETYKERGASCRGRQGDGAAEAARSGEGAPDSHQGQMGRCSGCSL